MDIWPLPLSALAGVGFTVTACAIMGLDSVAMAAQAGAQVLTWLMS